MNRQRVLVARTPEITAKLKANPGQWYAIAGGDISKRHTYAQTALRIRNGTRAGFKPAGAYEATVDTNVDRDNPVELWARRKPISLDANGGSVSDLHERLQLESASSEPLHS